MLFSRWIQQQWQQVGLWHFILFPLSIVFLSLVFWRRLAYRIGFLKSHKLPVPVIVVGNISVGGAGKTPLVSYLAKQLKTYGYSPGIISRGYGANLQSLVVEVTAQDNPLEVGDEPVLLARQTSCPVFVSAKRYAAALSLLRAHPECNVILSDDGLQHYAIKREIEIAVVDAQRGFSNGLLLPAGPLREPVSRLDDVDAVVLNGGISGLDQQNTFSMQLEPADFRQVINTDKSANVRDFAGKKIVAVAGIGNPSRFFKVLDQLGLTHDDYSFPDHHAFQKQELSFPQADLILMTEKDAVKCKEIADDRCWFLPVSSTLDSTFMPHILKLLGYQ